MLYYSGDKKIFHIHIPRTAGRYIKEIFISNFYEVTFANYSYRFYGIEIPHLHYPLYNFLEDVEDSPHFAIVRNPYDRFKSHIKKIIKANHFDKTIVESMKDKNFLRSFLDNEKYKSMYQSNVLRNQIEFISPKTKIYKFENGFGINYIDWMNENFNLNLKNFSVSYQKSGEENKNSEIIFDSSIEKTIREYYSEDYEYFNYD